MAKAYRSGLRPWSRSNVVPVLDNIDVMVTSDTDGVIALATKGGEICLKFGAFCRNHLCQESWDFIVDVTKYEEMVRIGFVLVRLLNRKFRQAGKGHAYEK